MKNEKSSQEGIFSNGETFEDLLDAYARDIANQATKAAAYERQAILDYVKRLEAHPMYYSDGQRPPMTGEQMLEEIKRLQANQITPDMMDVYADYQAQKAEADSHDSIIYPREMGHLQRDLWDAFMRTMEGE